MNKLLLGVALATCLATTAKADGLTILDCNTAGGEQLDIILPHDVPEAHIRGQVFPVQLIEMDQAGSVVVIQLHNGISLLISESLSIGVFDANIGGLVDGGYCGSVQGTSL